MWADLHRHPHTRPPRRRPGPRLILSVWGVGDRASDPERRSIVVSIWTPAFAGEVGGMGIEGALPSEFAISNPAKSSACRFYTPANPRRSAPRHNPSHPRRGGGRLDPAQNGGGDRLSGAVGGSRRRPHAASLPLQGRARVTDRPGPKPPAERQGGDRTSRLSWIVGLGPDVAVPVGPRPSGG